MAPNNNHEKNGGGGAAGGDDHPAADDGATAGDVAPDALEDEELLELSRLRCPSLLSEEVEQRKRARKKRCADYPGLAFTSTVSSDTMMKFSVIKNELHNLTRQQLRRVDGEMTALSARIKALDANLEKSEHYIKTATAALADAVQYQTEHRRDGDEEEDALTRFDAEMKLLEGKLKQARSLVEED